MAKQTIKTVFQLRRAHTEEWLQYPDTVPAEGEPCFDIDLNTLRIGDGKTPYSELKPIGGAQLEVAADGKSIVLKDGTFQIAGFDAEQIGAQPRVGEDGSIEWFIPYDAEAAVSALETSVTNIQNNVTTLETKVTNIQEIVGTSEGGSDTLLSRIVTLETKMDGTGEGTVDDKIDEKINAFATELSNDGKINTLLELINYVAEHGEEAADMASDISALQELVGTTPVQQQILDIVNASGHMDEEKANVVFEHVKYEVSHKPVGTLVDYREKEIRVMVPADTQFEHQNSGENSDANAYYIGLKAYAPEGAASFKEDTAEIISDETMYYFEGNEFAGIDAYGRKYSIVWLPVARYADGAWTHYGAMSGNGKYIGWYYSVEWYDADGRKMDADCIRINLSNENCHTDIEPYYMANVVKSVSVGGTLLDTVDGKVEIPVGAGLKSSEEILVDEDGTLSVGTINISKIEQDDDNMLVLDGGGAAIE